jgi:hypothetical protein
VRSSGLLRSEQWLDGEDGTDRLSRNVINYRYSLRNNTEERSSQGSCMSLLLKLYMCVCSTINENSLYKVMKVAYIKWETREKETTWKIQT